MGAGADTGRNAGPALASGPKMRRAAQKVRKGFSNFIFNKFSNNSFKIPF
jgi:hypothetical protein